MVGSVDNQCDGDDRRRQTSVRGKSIVAGWKVRLRKSLFGRQVHWFLLAAFAVLSIGLYLASGPIDRYDDRRSLGGSSMRVWHVVVVPIDGDLRPLSWAQAWRDQPQTIDGYARAGPIESRALGVPIPLFKECYQIIDEALITLYQVSESDEIGHPLLPDFSKIARQWSYDRGDLDQSPYADILPEIAAVLDQEVRPGRTLITWLFEQDGLPISRISWPALAYNVGLLTTIIIGVAAVLAWIGSIVNRERLLLRAGRCPNCRYLLVGLVDPRCPECGRALTASEWAHVQAAEIEREG